MNVVAFLLMFQWKTCNERNTPDDLQAAFDTIEVFFLEIFLGIVYQKHLYSFSVSFWRPRLFRDLKNFLHLLLASRHLVLLLNSYLHINDFSNSNLSFYLLMSLTSMCSIESLTSPLWDQTHCVQNRNYYHFLPKQTNSKTQRNPFLRLCLCSLSECALSIQVSKVDPDLSLNSPPLTH